MVMTLHSHCWRAWVQSLVRELKSHMPHGAAKNSKKRKIMRGTQNRVEKKRHEEKSHWKISGGPPGGVCKRRDGSQGEGSWSADLETLHPELPLSLSREATKGLLVSVLSTRCLEPPSGQIPQGWVSQSIFNKHCGHSLSRVSKSKTGVYLTHFELLLNVAWFVAAPQETTD